MVAAVAWATPAAAVEAGGSICAPLTGSSLLGGSASVANGIAGRGGEVREPDLGQVHADLPASAKGRAKAGFRATVPVYFHVITAGSVGNLTDRQISAQMSVLSATFAGAEGGAKTGFSFKLAGVTRTDNAAWFFAGPGGTDEHST
jgi:hypothetical protein